MISPPACYGKIPAYGDFYQHRAAGAAADAWWTWFTRSREKCDFSAGRTPVWCFALPPGAMSWSDKNFVLGALCGSQDRVGRHFPLVAWQTAKTAGMMEILREATGAAPERNWLFWLSRLLGAVTEQNRGQTSFTGTGPGFGARLDGLWNMFKPGWLARLGLGKSLGGRSAPSLDNLQALVGGLPPDDLHGVSRLPWADWPERLAVPGATACFWAMDNQGRYLRAFTGGALDGNLLERLFGPV